MTGKNFVEIYQTWTDFKSIIETRSIIPQWVEAQKKFMIFAQDGFLLFIHELEKTNTDDLSDFENNYKDTWNQKLEYRDNRGIPQVSPTPRPPNTMNYFTSAGDVYKIDFTTSEPTSPSLNDTYINSVSGTSSETSQTVTENMKYSWNGSSWDESTPESPNGIGEGNKFIVSILSSETEKYIDLCFNEDIYIIGGVVTPINAPFGALFDVSVVHPTYGIVDKFCNNVSIYDSNQEKFDGNDTGFIPSGVLIRLKVHNSTGQNGQDAPTDFKLSGIIRLYRENTY